MNHPTDACDLELLKVSLTEAIGEAEEQRLAEHLSGCEYCQTQLADFAAQGDTWNRVSDVLRKESRELKQPASNGDFQQSSLGTVRVFSGSSIDFAVEFLEPCSRPDALGQLGDIAILEMIGHGGMGIVLKGFQTKLNRPVAVKVLAPHLATSGAARQRFAREAQAVAVISHPNVMPIFAVDDSGKLPYIVMPYVDCDSLQDRIDRDGRMPVIDTMRIGVQVADGLAAAHAQGIVHRDIKPANVLIEPGVDRVMLTDFGLARAADDASLTRTGVIAGTPQFMSPEQAKGDAINTQSDLFSLGSMLYTMLAGRPPFRAESSYAILRRIIDTDARRLTEINPDVPPWLENFVSRLMAKNPDQRFANSEEVAELMRSSVAHLQQPHTVELPCDFAWERDESRLHERFRNAVQTFFGVAIVLGVFFFAVRFMLPEGTTRQSTALPTGHTSPAYPLPPPATTEWNDGIDDAITDLSTRIEAMKVTLQDP